MNKGSTHNVIIRYPWVGQPT